MSKIRWTKAELEEIKSWWERQKNLTRAEIEKEYDRIESKVRRIRAIGSRSVDFCTMVFSITMYSVVNKDCAPEPLTDEDMDSALFTAANELGLDSLEVEAEILRRAKEYGDTSEKIVTVEI